MAQSVNFEAMTTRKGDLFTLACSGRINYVGEDKISKKDFEREIMKYAVEQFKTYKESEIKIKIKIIN